MAAADASVHERHRRRVGGDSAGRWAGGGRERRIQSGRARVESRKERGAEQRGSERSRASGWLSGQEERPKRKRIVPFVCFRLFFFSFSLVRRLFSRHPAKQKTKLETVQAVTPSAMQLVSNKLHGKIVELFYYTWLKFETNRNKTGLRGSQRKNAGKKGLRCEKCRALELQWHALTASWHLEATAAPSAPVSTSLTAPVFAAAPAGCCIGTARLAAAGRGTRSASA